MMNDKRLSNCSFIKTVLMILVILYHSCVFWTENWWSDLPVFRSVILNYLSLYLNSFHVYAFTLVSGYVFSFKVLNNGYRNFWPFLINKAKRLLIPYLFVMIVWVAPISAILFKWNIGYLVKKYILCVDPSQLWFLWMLFGVFAIAWPLRNIFLNNSLCGLLISLLFFVLGVIGKRYVPNYFCVWTAFQYVFFFFVGMRIRCEEEKRGKSFEQRLPWFFWLIADIALFVLLQLINQKEGIMWSVLSFSIGLFLHLVGAITAWIILQIIANKKKRKQKSYVGKLSIVSMPMYLFHQQIVYFCILALDGKIHPFLHATINFVIAFCVSYFISKVLMKWKFTRLLIGER